MRIASAKMMYSAALAVLVLSVGMGGKASAQNSSLFQGGDRQRPLTLREHSWTYQAPPEMKTIQLNDLVTIIVSEQSVVTSEGEVDRKKKAHGDLILKDWILLKGLFAYPDPQALGDPHIRGEVDNKMRSQGTIETRDSMKFRITVRIADIRPNGNLILEGHREIRNNSEVWDYSLTGEIRPEDVLPNNTVLSETVADLAIHKRETGHVRDAYRRGWLLRWLDKYQPF